MNRLRETALPATLLGMLATLVASWPMTGLFEEGRWLPPVLTLIVLQALVGVLGRMLRAPAALTLLAQLLAVAIGAVVLALGTSALSPGAWSDLPMLVNDLLYEARMTLTRYAAPAPVNDGVVFMLTLLLPTAAVLVDLLAATLRSPAAAGIPLLAIFLFSTSNTGDSMNPVFFLALGGVWLLLLSAPRMAVLRSWGTTEASSTVPETQADRFGLAAHAGRARIIGVLALLIAVVLPLAVPHLPTQYLADGLGRGNGDSDTASVGFTDSLDLSQNLNSQNQDPVLQYATTDLAPPPLKALTTSTYTNGQWRQSDSQDNDSGVDGRTLNLPEGMDSSAQGPQQATNIASNTLQTPYLATPWPMARADMDGQNWSYSSQSLLPRSSSRIRDYSITYRTLDSTARPTSDTVERGEVSQRTLQVDAESRSSVLTATASALRAGNAENSSAFDKAIAIQDWLRDPSLFTYSLQLAATRTGTDGQPLDPISNFLATRRGYCTQFSTAMVMMARSQGIPARVAVGFLPGTASGDGFVVRASDAHAWPELYFPGLGWTRFEPTPGVRAGDVPSYAVRGSEDTSNPTGQELEETDENTSTSGASSESTTTAAPTTTATQATPQSGDQHWFAPWMRWLALAIVAGLAGAVVLPLLARRRRQEQLSRAGDPGARVEAQWSSLQSRLTDLGIEDPGQLSPRQTEAHYRRYAHLDEPGRAALHRATQSLEASRYGSSTRTATIEEDTEQVYREVRDQASFGSRISATLFPRTGRRVVRDAWDRLRSRLTRSER
ncbi:transglutaminaseTgpA domain-containing protein [Dermacoccaceae bacterium W4C1]